LALAAIKGFAKDEAELDGPASTREGRTVTQMETLSRFVRDYFRLMAGRPLLGARPERSAEEKDARTAVERFSRGNVAVQDDRFVTENDLERERKQVAEFPFRN